MPCPALRRRPGAGTGRAPEFPQLHGGGHARRERPNGRIAVDEVWVSFDAGTIVNAGRVRSQMEGSVIFGMSLAFYGGITMKNGAEFRRQGHRGQGARLPESVLVFSGVEAPPKK